MKHECQIIKANSALGKTGGIKLILTAECFSLLRLSFLFLANIMKAGGAIDTPGAREIGPVSLCHRLP